nr:hypothetical protein CFP56_73599 [Quercus suber]
MGCSQSKIENKEAMSQYKDLKLYMKEAVSACNAFSATHSSYATYLKNTGAALSDYAHGEVSHHHHHSHSAPSLSFASPPHPLPPLTMRFNSQFLPDTIQKRPGSFTSQTDLCQGKSGRSKMFKGLDLEEAKAQWAMS